MEWKIYVNYIFNGDLSHTGIDKGSQNYIQLNFDTFHMLHNIPTIL